jgi:DNA-binding MarR family transcriptional regulator
VREEDWATATEILRLASELVEGIQSGLAARGYDDVRPAHGFAFVRLSAAPATTAQLAEYLGITKQAMSEVVHHLIARGYLARQPDPSDRRAQLLLLTDRGQACTRAAEQAAAETVGSWRNRLSTEQFAELQGALHAIAQPGRLRPAW